MLAFSSSPFISPWLSYASIILVWGGILSLCELQKGFGDQKIKQRLHQHSGELSLYPLTRFSVPFSLQFNETGRGSECSQAIMLVTDGAVDTYDAIFAKYNWPERKVVCQTRKTSHHITHIASSFSSGCCDRGKVRSARLNFPLHFFHNYLSLRPGILMENVPPRAGGPMSSCGCE